MSSVQSTLQSNNMPTVSLRHLLAKCSACSVTHGALTGKPGMQEHAELPPLLFAGSHAQGNVSLVSDYSKGIADSVKVLMQADPSTSFGRPA